jgi:hypothetical protein
MAIVNGEVGGTSQLEQLAEAITQNAHLISSFLRDNVLPQPSFELDAPLSTLPTTAPEAISKARQVLMDTAMRIFQLAVGPNEYLPHLALGVCKAFFLLLRHEQIKRQKRHCSHLIYC